jgi:hypothetical protein
MGCATIWATFSQTRQVALEKCDRTVSERNGKAALGRVVLWPLSSPAERKIVGSNLARVKGF